MGAYLIRRLLLIIPTLLGIMLLNFIIIQVAPGGPVEQAIAQLTGEGVGITERVTRTGAGETLSRTVPGQQGENRVYRGAQGLDLEFIRELEVRFGFDKPLHERFLRMMRSYLLFDFGQSFFRDRAVVQLILDKMPVSISLGIWTTLLVYLISIPLGIAKAVRDGGRFDTWTMLTKNSFLDQLHQQYVLTAKAKGLTQHRVLYGHVFRNAMLIVIAGFPAAFVGILFTGSVLIEVIFSLDGLGLLGFEAAFNRDYPLMFGTLYIFSLLGLLLNLVGDLMYTVVDPRIDFARREV